MRAVLQRVSSARVLVGETVVGEIGAGLLALVCAMQGDTSADVAFMAGKIADLRIFPDAAGRMNNSLVDTNGQTLVVSQFTLAADTTSGLRPGFSHALEPGQAKELCRELAQALRARGLVVAEGRFGEQMRVQLENDGPVTILLDSQAKQRK